MILEDLKNKEFVFIYFSKKSCDVCKIIFPKLEKLLEKYEKGEMIKIDLDEELEMTSKFLVFSIPSLIVLNKEKELLRVSRFFNFDEIEKKLDYYSDLIFK